MRGTLLKKLIASAALAMMVAGGAGVAQAGHTDDGSGHLPQDHGLCTAYFNGSEQGQEKKRENGKPFGDLEIRADDGDDSTSAEDDVRAFCGDLIGGRAGREGSTTPGGDKSGPKN